MPAKKTTAHFRRSALLWQVVIAGVGALIVIGFLLQSASAYSTVLVASSGGTYAEAIVGGPRYLNPILCQLNEVDADISSLVFNGLTKLDERGNVVPDLASSWEISQDGKQYIFQLRNDVLWQDGVPLAAEDVVFTVQMLQSADYSGSPSVANLWRDVQAQALGEHTVLLQLQEPYSPFLTYTNIGILPAHILKGVPAKDLPQVEFNRLPIGTGPFVVIESDATHVTLQANADYYGEHPYLDKIAFYFYRNTGDALRAYERGEVQSIADVSSEYLPQLAAESKLDLYSAPLAQQVTVLVNLKSANATFLGDKDLRKALFMALDRETLIASVLEGRGLVAQAPYAPFSWALNPKGKTISYDQAGAEKSLAALGWEDHNGDGIRDKDGKPLTFDLATYDQRVPQAVAQELSRQWRQVGVQANVVVVPFTELVNKKLAPRQFDCALVEISMEGDPDPYSLWHSSQAQGNGQNYSSLVDKDVDQLLETARREWATSKRQEMYYQFQDIFADELPAFPLYYPVYTYAVDKNVHGVQIGPLNTSADRFRTVAQWYMNYRRLRMRQAAVEPGE